MWLALGPIPLSESPNPQTFSHTKPVFKKKNGFAFQYVCANASFAYNSFSPPSILLPMAKITYRIPNAPGKSLTPWGKYLPESQPSTFPW